ncbi:MAG TPA: hypothetical protein DCE41_25555 [Cytophagales bacterium]|nr:hypothetical protein [Cytophagales bacterium]HAA19906.1 hypothetical protein [Cytophagales bacterium]HAP62666.1 hypothetical protein [Cytophagales bacterium]
MRHITLLTLIGMLALGFQACERPFTYDPNDVPVFEGLEAPTADEGHQIHVPPFPVPAQYEREFFLRMPIGNTEEIYVSRFQSLCRPGTHHLIAYGYEDENDPRNPEVGVMRDQNLSDGRGNFNLTMGDGAMYYLTQEPNFTLELPEGSALKIPGNATVDINSHYFNATDEIRFGEVYLNFYTVPQEEITEVLVVDDINNSDELYLPPGETTDVEYVEMFDETVEIRMMLSHMHKRGIQFDVYYVGGERDGELIYSAFDYQHPPTQFFEPLLSIPAGEGLRTVVRYFNETNRAISFGVTSEDEMGILFYLRKEI